MKLFTYTDTSLQNMVLQIMRSFEVSSKKTIINWKQTKYLILPAAHLTVHRQKKAQREKSNMKENSDQKKVIKVIAWGEPTVGACYSIMLGSNGAEENL